MSLSGDKIIFNTTPSPGASVCLGNAHRDAKRIVEFLGSEYHFDEELFQKELVPINPSISSAPKGRFFIETKSGANCTAP